MFYSQFILAKKGPLGTIWIAAHLERKLRKNQVADTDIGVSVDSIIFPEVPIALRLSSHLLLGVVRIYSRKVNYLFDDCSEALLKIKQAFRSTAVDLPPEESTAPYHSITLPETFDLDDFELPENEIFQGNYVDHHVSSREQITLQDTMEGVVYSTSQFGPDERFGDGGTCEINLELDEVDFMQKFEEVVCGESHDSYAFPHPITPKEEVEDDNGDNQVGFITADSKPPEYAEAPATPGLVEEANLSSVKKALNSDDRLSESVPENDISVDNQANVNSTANLEPAFTFSEEFSDTAHGSSNLENGASNEKDLQTLNLHIDNVGQEEDCGKQDVLHIGIVKEVLSANFIHPVSDDNERAELLLTENMEVCIVPNGQSENVQAISISEAPPIETLRLAIGEAAGEADDLFEDLTPDKEFLEDQTSNVKISNISGKKCSLKESTMTEESSGMSFSKRTLESVPDDDDLLSSILVGKRSAVLKLKPSPAPSELTFSKRRRINQYVAVAHKRKVLIDDSMVLHGDAIRQQLTNAEDLRRIRKKAPCTLPEISSLQRQFLGDAIFNETVFTGFSVELHYLHEAYDLSHVRVVEPTQPIVPVIGVDLPDKPIMICETEIGASFETQLIGDGDELIPKITESGSCSKPNQVEDLGIIPEVLKSQQVHVDNVTEMELDTENVERFVQDCSAVSGTEMRTVTAIFYEDAESAAGTCVGKFHSGTEDLGACACLCAVHAKPMTVDPQCAENDSSKGSLMIGKRFDGAEENVFRVDSGGETQEMGEASVEGNASLDYDGTNMEKACGFPTNELQGDIRNRSTYGNAESENIENASANYQGQLEQNVQELLYNQSPIDFHDDFDNSLGQNVNVGRGFGYEESTSCFDPQCSRDGEIPGVENTAVDLNDDFEDTMAMHDTEFLNMDDDDDAVGDEGTADADDPQFLENRGWSVRTRGVAKYLQSLFQKERLVEIHGKEVVVIDNLLAGKTRKEASRLFFESLVLKTRDYINVEQRRPYDNIIVMPRAILMKSEF